MSGRSLVAFINGQAVGSLLEADDVWSFQYAANWLESPERFPLSPHLPLRAEPMVDGASQRSVQWYFDNLLPEEGQRLLLAGEARLDQADAFGLLSFYGAESAGSVVLLPQDEREQAPVLLPLTHAALSARIRQMPGVPLMHAASKRMSLAGAQHKLAIVMEQGELFEPAGAFPSTHILKPDHPAEDYPHSVVNEWFVMRLAGKLGLDVPPVYRCYVPEPIYVVERFDRIKTEHGWQRLHAIDACQLSGLSRQFKYQQGSVERLAQLANTCRSSAIARIRLFNWLVFNILVGNNDAHLKNVSFLVTAGGIQLAPHYDLLSTACYESRAFDKTAWPERSTLAWPVCGVEHFSGISRQHLLGAGSVLGLAAATAARVLDKLISDIMPMALSLCTEFERENASLREAHPELALVLAGELRCVKAIIHTVISEMVQRLR